MFEYAVGRGYSMTVVQLLSAGLSVDAATRALWSALYRTSYSDRPTGDEVVYLKGLGADVSVPNSRGETMFEYAVGRGYNVEILELLEGSIRKPSPTPTATPSLTPRPTPELRLRGSGTLYAVAGDGYTGCPTNTNEPAQLSTNSIAGKVTFSFEVPSAPSWSIGLLYHSLPDEQRTFTATFLHRPLDSPVEAWHFTVVDRQFVGDGRRIVVQPRDFDQTVGALNAMTVTTSNRGTVLEVNGTQVLTLPRADLRPVHGWMGVCVGILKVEPQDYLIDYIDLRAWTE